MWEFLLAIAPLFTMIYKEWLSHEAKANAEKTAFTLDQATLKKIVDAAVNDWNESNQKKSQDAANVWDAADSDTDKKS